MATLALLKGVRTKYRKTLEKELTKARGLLQSDVSTVSKVDFVIEIEETKTILKTYSDKLTLHMDKITEHTDDAELIQSVLDEDCDLNVEVGRFIFKLGLTV